MPASSKHKYSKILAFPDTYYELIINLLQSVELFCAYLKTMEKALKIEEYREIREKKERASQDLEGSPKMP